MNKTPAPLLGFNNNVRHRGRIFHIQTEDSGVRIPRIVTHLFADGGRIVKTKRTDYAEHVGQKDMMPIVRRLMKEQHKAMFVALRAGELDELLEQICGPLPPESPSASMPAADRVAPESVALEVPSPSQVHASPEPLTNPTPALGTVTAAAAATATAAPTDEEAVSSSTGRPRSLSNPALRRVTASVPPPPVEELDLAVGSLEPSAPSSPEPKRRHTPPPIPRGGTPAHGTPSTAAQPGRYAAPRPTAIFTKPTPEKQSIFGENVISEQSLDEVILSYLAEDLEDRPAK